MRKNAAVEFTEVDGISFYPTKQGYWLGNADRKPKRMHVYVWEKANGPAPAGYDIHHIDGDKSNNSIENLTLVQSSNHRSHHASLIPYEKKIESLKAARVKASEWHKSDAGREWARENYKSNCGEMWSKRETKACLVCGKEFTVPAIVGYKSKYCSNTCKAAARRLSGKDTELRACEICGNVRRVNKYSKARTCSRSCGDEMRRREKGRTAWQKSLA